MKKAWMMVFSAMLMVESANAAGIVLYDLNFSSPEVGNYSTVFGNPSVEASVGPLSNAMVFDALTSYEQIRLLINRLGQRFEIGCDVLVHNLLDSEYAFTILLDTPNVRTVSFHGGMNKIYNFPNTAERLSFVNDRVYHLDLVADFPLNQWTLDVDGERLFSIPINATELKAIRFDMSPRILGASNGPGVYAALDNVVVRVVPEPNTMGLLIVALLTLQSGPLRRLGRVRK